MERATVNSTRIVVPDDLEEELRVDRYLSEECPEFSRSYLQKLIKSGDITVNVKQVKVSYCVKTGDIIDITEPQKVMPDICPEELPLDILYEDADVILVNKPKGMVVHPAFGHYSGTLVNALMFHCKEGGLSGINGVLRPGIVHRIDRDTTGVLIVCKNDFSHQNIAAQLKEHSITRRYFALVHGNIKEDEMTIDAPIGRSDTDRKKMAINYRNGKEAVTHVKVLERFGMYTFVECRLETGRTHQIRVHLSSKKHPLYGDYVYGPDAHPKGCDGQALHAYVLGFVHPRTNEYMEFQAPLPEYFEKILKKLREGNQL